MSSDEYKLMCLHFWYCFGYENMGESPSPNFKEWEEAYKRGVEDRGDEYDEERVKEILRDLLGK